LGPAGEDTPIDASAVNNAEASDDVRGLDLRGVSSAGKVNVGTAALVVIVKPGDVGLNAVHRRHLKRRRRGGNADTHRMQSMSLRAQHLRNVRHVPFRKRALEHLARKAVDLHDDKTPPYPLGPAAVPESPDQAVERALQEEEETVQRSGPRRVV